MEGESLLLSRPPISFLEKGVAPARISQASLRYIA
jgi:hypothetical protein